MGAKFAKKRHAHQLIMSTIKYTTLERMVDNEKILEAISRYKFYHIIQLTETIVTPGNALYVPAQNLCLKHLESLDLREKKVLDIGCRDGLFSFKAETMGAKTVVGIDNDLSKPATQFLIPFFNSNIRMTEMNLYDLRPDNFGRFDAVIFAGVLYHLRYPFWSLKIIRDIMKPDGHLLIETAIWHGEPGDKAMLFCPIDGPYGDDVTSCTFFNERGLVDTMKSLGFETMSIEYLPQPTNNDASVRTIKSRIEQRIKKTVREALLKRGFTKFNLTLDRCVFHLVYRGYDEEQHLFKYWEKKHESHTMRGG
jgi:2-polyprenyl-3-methyl-5-hydroxy-6-metoxy-1,4-benzoquinol methylase